MSFYDNIHETVAALVMFYSPENKASIQMMPIVEDIKKKMQGSAQVMLVNIDENQRTAEREKITELPTFALYRYGRCFWRESGIVAESELLDRLNAAAYPDPANELGHHPHRHHEI